MNKTEKERWKKFKSWHYENCSKDIHTGTIGVNLATYTVQGTSIGEIIKAKCLICNQEIDITNYEMW